MPLLVRLAVKVFREALTAETAGVRQADRKSVALHVARERRGAIGCVAAAPKGAKVRVHRGLVNRHVPRKVAAAVRAAEAAAFPRAREGERALPHGRVSRHVLRKVAAAVRAAVAGAAFPRAREDEHALPRGRVEGPLVPRQ